MTPKTSPAETLAFASARPYAFNFVPSRTALVLIDLQRDFVDPGGFGAIQCGSPDVFAKVRSVVPKTQAALAAARSLGLHIVHTREGHRPDLADLSAAKHDRQLDSPNGHHTAGIGDKGPMGRLLVRGEYGHDIVDELRPRPGEVVVDKPGKGSFWATNLHRKLMARGVTHLVFCGVTTECCVTTSAREASDRGFQCCILEDCTGGFDAAFVTASIDMIVSFDGLFGFAAGSAELIALAQATTNGLTNPQTSSAASAGEDKQLVDIATLERQYKQSALSPVDVVARLYQRIEAYERENPHAWILLRSQEEVLADARALEAKYAGTSREELPPLYGLPFAVKDSYDIAGLPTTAACPDFTYVATATAPTVTAALSAGALLLGKTNMDQLATGLSGCRSPYGISASVFGGGKFVSGGSSSGSAVVVGAHLVSFALGTDTAGSGRVPAALNGIVGFKPTKGTLSYRGIVPCCRSLDTATIFAQSVTDARKVWYVINEYDDQDAFAHEPSTLPLALADYRGVRRGGFTCAVPPAAALAVCSDAFSGAFAQALRAVEAVGGRLTTLDDAAYEPFEAATELLYNGTLVNERIACIGPEFILANIDRFHPTTKMLYAQVLERATKPWDVFTDKLVQAEATRKAARLFSKQGGGGVDVLVVPTAPCHPTIAEMEAAPIALNAKLGAFTHFGNVLDLCAVSVNAGYVDGGMPFGVCFVGAKGMDGHLLDIATEFERMVSSRQ
ncbi:Amidase [Niveomyces insectorum RCEF 264]|uniref:Amidase n=1 Tax=Niveomyces insectorum RCEF 264 TaxID=1081102 RepID=A0A167XXZ6_9HYPO|nr:Amidase [Niveomyces insectorum RCEF 264]